MPGPRVDGHNGSGHPNVRRVGPQDLQRVHAGHARHHALQGDPRVVRPHGQSELRIRVLVVVLNEVTVRVLAQLLGRAQLVHRVRVRDQVVDLNESKHDGHEHDTHRHPSNLIEGVGQRHLEKACNHGSADARRSR